MTALQKDDITNIYCCIDEMLPKKDAPRGGRPQTLTSAELLTILVWVGMTEKHQTLRAIYAHLNMHYRGYFRFVPSYPAFVDSVHRATPDMVALLEQVLDSGQPFRFVDSTMLEVCKSIRADSHRVARSIAAWGKNWQGWHYGFKLHASVSLAGALSQLTITPANNHDAQAMPKILNRHCRVAVGDTLYGARVMGERIWRDYGTIVIAPVHPSQKRKLSTKGHLRLLAMRPKIETVFDYLKQHMHLVSSFPRSVVGYFVHYLRTLISYQFLRLGGHIS